MSNFLRKSRKGINMKYAKYAVGEITLVVIGILIALSINNWNERRKERKIQQDIIDEMLTSLESDRNLFMNLDERLVQKDSAIQHILNIKEAGLQLTENELGALMSFAGQYIALSYDDSPYEALVSIGIDKFSDKELLNQIVYYYSLRLPRTEQFLKEELERYLPTINRLERQALEEGLIDKSFERNAEGNWYVKWTNEADEIMNSDIFYQLLVNNHELYYGLDFRLKELIIANEELITALTKK